MIFLIFVSFLFVLHPQIPDCQIVVFYQILSYHNKPYINESLFIQLSDDAYISIIKKTHMTGFCGPRSEIMLTVYKYEILFIYFIFLCTQ